ncbi:hypothetical protein [Picrophilus oshimae]|nr:hypothetical protein [Picrophilus oshimae]
MVNEDNNLNEGGGIIHKIVAGLLILSMIAFIPIFLYGFFRFAARHLVTAFLVIGFFALLAIKIMPIVYYNGTQPVTNMVRIMFFLLPFEYILALVYDIAWGWKHPHEVKRNRMSGAVYETYWMYLVTFFFYLVVAYGLVLKNPSGAFSVFWYFSLIVSIFFTFGSLFATMSIRFEKQINEGKNVVEKVIR